MQNARELIALTVRFVFVSLLGGVRVSLECELLYAGCEPLEEEHSIGSIAPNGRGIYISHVPNTLCSCAAMGLLSCGRTVSIYAVV
jgi:hypothetical protein